MKNFILKNKFIIYPSLVGLVGVVIVIIIRSLFDLSQYTGDLGGINNFIAIYGTLFGLLLAFVVFEVWNEYNSTSQAVSNEASQIERVYRISRYFRDSDFDENMKFSFVNYLDRVIDYGLSANSEGKRDPIASQKFREISTIIENVKFNDDHDNIVFSQIINEYSKLSELRNLRIELAITRLPSILKYLLYSASAIAIILVSFMPFLSPIYHSGVAFALYFLLSMIFILINDLDNPFTGIWTIGTDDYKRVKDNILNNYK